MFPALARPNIAIKMCLAHLTRCIQNDYPIFSFLVANTSNLSLRGYISWKGRFSASSPSLYTFNTILHSFGRVDEPPLQYLASPPCPSRCNSGNQNFFSACSLYLSFAALSRLEGSLNCLMWCYYRDGNELRRIAYCLRLSDRGARRSWG